MTMHGQTQRNTNRSAQAHKKDYDNTNKTRHTEWWEELNKNKKYVATRAFTDVLKAGDGDSKDYRMRKKLSRREGADLS